MLIYWPTALNELMNPVELTFINPLKKKMTDQGIEPVNPAPLFVKSCNQLNELPGQKSTLGKKEKLTVMNNFSSFYLIAFQNQMTLFYKEIYENYQMNCVWRQTINQLPDNKILDRSKLKKNCRCRFKVHLKWKISII